MPMLNAPIAHGASELARVTVVIPTFERRDFVERQCKYWADQGPQVLILDGSKTPMESSFTTTLPKNVRYLYSPTSFRHRRFLATNLINTEFAILLPDDEFYLIGGLLDCVSHLDKNPETIGCTGKVLCFFVEREQFRAFLSYEDWKPFPAECRSLRERLDFSLPPSKAHKVEFCLFRSSLWREIFAESYRDEYSCGYVYERLLNLCAAIQGRTDLINSVLLLRSLENPPINSADAPRTGVNNFISWATSGMFADETRHYEEKARRIIGSAEELTQHEIEIYVTRFVRGGVQRQIEKERRNNKKMGPRLTRIVVARVPKKIRRAAKRFLPSQFRNFLDLRGDTIDFATSKLDDRGIRYDRFALDSVATLVCQTSRTISM